MGTVIKELVQRGHDLAAELNASCGAVDVRSVAKLISDLASQLDCTTAALREMTKQRDASDQAERVWETTMMQACGEDGPKSVADKFTELEAKCAALAAENAALKRNLEGTAEFCYSELPETPATDAFLAEVRAQGVEEFLRDSQLPYQIATVLADYDNVDDATLQTVIWSGQPPEPDGDVWHLEYVSRGNTIVRAILKGLREGVQS